jgi:hypothetical protein
MRAYSTEWTPTLADQHNLLADSSALDSSSDVLFRFQLTKFPGPGSRPMNTFSATTVDSILTLLWPPVDPVTHRDDFRHVGGYQGLRYVSQFKDLAHGSITGAALVAYRFPAKCLGSRKARRSKPHSRCLE